MLRLNPKALSILALNSTASKFCAHWTLFVAPGKLVSGEKGPIMKREQLEMSFNGSTSHRPPLRALSRRSRAKWWFHQMRMVVDTALDWKPLPAARPEQTYLGLKQNDSITRSE
jgi:hypothetical protein